MEVSHAETLGAEDPGLAFASPTLASWPPGSSHSAREVRQVASLRILPGRRPRRAEVGLGRQGGPGQEPAPSVLGCPRQGPQGARLRSLQPQAHPPALRPCAAPHSLTHSRHVCWCLAEPSPGVTQGGRSPWSLKPEIHAGGSDRAPRKRHREKGSGGETLSEVPGQGQQAVAFKQRPEGGGCSAAQGLPFTYLFFHHGCSWPSPHICIPAEEGGDDPHPSPERGPEARHCTVSQKVIMRPHLPVEKAGTWTHQRLELC